MNRAIIACARGGRLMQRNLLPLLLCLLLTACIKSNVDSKRMTTADADLKPLRSLLIFVESDTAASAQEVETVVAKELTDAGVTVQLGTAHIAHDASTNQVFAKADMLGVDGALIVAIESTGVETDRNPMPVYGPGYVYRPDSTSALVGQYSARLFDTRVKGKHTKVWQAKANARAGTGSILSFATANDITHDAARQIVRELAREDLIARSEQ